MFEKTLSDVVKGIRASKRDTGLYISQCIAEIKTELHSTDLFVKANALQKLTFLQMMGYSMSYSSFATIEVMSSPRFAHKRVGYLAASQGFTQDTEVILLTTNTLKKELRGATSGNMQGVYEAGLAINCISNIVTEDLARDLLPEVTQLTSHPQPYLRKKAVLCLFKLFVKYPQGLRLTFDKIEQCLGDTNPSVVSCAVNVITELSDKNPRNYLHLAPGFFSLLTGSTNNWMLIKVVKLLGSLVPEEPRLARKLLEPLANMVKQTQAKSLLFEAVHTLCISLPYCRKSDGSMPAIVPDIVELCANTLKGFVEEQDQNLKYLGLVGFGSLMLSHPKVLTASSEYRPLLLQCLSDEDITIRTRALDLLNYMASRKNLVELVTQLWSHVDLAAGTYKHDLVAKILEMCSGDKYALLTDFGWYFNLLLGLGHMRGIETHAELLKQQLWDVALRVLPVRTYAVRRSMEQLLPDKREQLSTTTLPEDGVVDNGRGKHIMPELLPALAWIVGEYSSLIRDAVQEAEEDEDSSGDFSYDSSTRGVYHALLQVLLAPSNIRELPTSTQSIYVQAAMKIFAAATADKHVSGKELEACVDTLTRLLPIFTESTDTEVQERAFSSLEILRSFNLVSSDGCIVPGLARVEDDDEDSDDDGNLLDITSSKEKKSMSSPPSLSRPLSKKCRDAADVLNYMFKPEPMKPTSIKAQRKKCQAPVGVDVEFLNAPVDLSVFASFLEEERALRPTGGTLSMESVSFTQQRPLRPTAPAAEYSPTVATMDLSGFGGVSNGGASTSFQKTGMPEISSAETSGLATQQQRQRHDPFYLDSGAPSETESAAATHRFGAIQLQGSEDESDEPNKKKKKKQKKAKRPKQTNSNISVLGDADMAMFSTVDTSMPKPPRASASTKMVTVYSSDGDDEESDPHLSGHVGKKKGPGKEFSGLAKVDLTTPLRDDEVMPTREHRVVPERRPDQKKASPKKKKKKDSKKNKKSPSAEVAAGGNGVGDLLDLGGFMPVAEVPSEAVTLSVPVSSAGESNAISTAFDDLLGLSSPTETSIPEMQPSLAMDGNEAAKSPEKKKKHTKRVWMKAAIKASSAGGSPVVDWTKVSLSYRVHAKMEVGSVAATVTFRVENHMETGALSNLSLKLKGHDDVTVGTVPPGSHAEVKAGGTFPYEIPENSMEIKGSLFTPECKVPVKVTLPATVFLTPWSGLDQDDVLQQLSSSSSRWYSHSIKLYLTVPGEAAQRLLGFFHAAQVEDSTPVAGTLAAQSAQGSLLLALFKVRETSVKVDLKCTNDTLGKALVSDLKKLMLL